MAIACFRFFRSKGGTCDVRGKVYGELLGEVLGEGGDLWVGILWEFIK